MPKPVRRAKAIAFAALLSAMAAATLAADAPRIGLTLGGGGARGIAHVGVLRVLEEMRVPVHCVAGTSMGAIVGALYALGLSPDEIETLLLTADWDQIFSDRPRRFEQSFRRKEDDRADFLDFEVGIRDGRLALPSAYVAGQNLSFAFDLPDLHTEGVRSFDSLRLPFRAVATDVQSGEMRALSGGSLLRAVRASMAIPGVFAPVEVDGRLLVDGGLVRNVPVDVARGMGADIVIAVNVGEDLAARTPQDLASPLGFSLQLISLIVTPNVRESLEDANVVVSPELADVTLIDFERSAEIVQIGERAAHAVAAQLEAYRVAPDAFAEHIRRHRRTGTPRARIDSIAVDNRTRIGTPALRARLQTPPGTPFTLHAARSDMVRLIDLGLVESADFDLLTARATGDTSRVMQVHVHEKTYGPNLFRFGLTFDSDLEGNARFSGRARLNTVELNRRGAEWRNDFALGTQSHVASEWYQPLDLQRRWFIAPRLAYRSDYEDVYAGDLTSRYRMQEAQARVDFGVQIGRPGELRTGPYFGWGRAEIKTGAPGLPETEGRLGGWWTRIAVDVVDAPDAPTSGAAGVLELTLDREAFGSEYGFDRLGAECDIFATWLGNTGFLELEGGTSMGTDLPPFAKFRIGGLHSLSGLHAGELVGDAFGVLRVGLSRPITGEVDLFGTRLHVAGWFEAGNAWPTTDDALDGLRYTGTVSLWADTILGPVHVAEGWADGGDATLYITLGQQFGLGR